MKPTISKQSEGWWWVKIFNKWCVALVQYVDDRPCRGEHLAVRVVNTEGMMCMSTLEAGEVVKEQWGGRIQEPKP